MVEDEEIEKMRQKDEQKGQVGILVPVAEEEEANS